MIAYYAMTTSPAEDYSKIDKDEIGEIDMVFIRPGEVYKRVNKAPINGIVKFYGINVDKCVKLSEPNIRSIFIEVDV